MDENDTAMDLDFASGDERSAGHEQRPTDYRTTPNPVPVIPFPLALYESNGVIFELYRGGRSYEKPVIRWERLKTFTVTREGDLTFNIRVSQAHRETPTE